MSSYRRKLFLAIVCALVLVVAPAATSAAPSPKRHKPVCPTEGKDSARCHAQVIVSDNLQPMASAAPSGYGPAQFQAAYGLAGKTSAGRIVAIVDAYHQPNMLSDLTVYSNQFGLPVLPACSGAIKSASGACFQQVNQNGAVGSYPGVDGGWALETSMDVETVHAVCPDCKILLVEANSASFADLMKAVDTAVALGASVVSNSYGGNEFSGETTYDAHFNKTGVAFTFSSGDSGYGTSYPAASRYVTAVGGTTLTKTATGYSETAWSGAGSGCSRYEAKPSFQHDSGCAKRTIADVSADADPNTGAAVYDTVPYSGQTGWFQVGGTSLSAPIIAGVYALGGVSGQANSMPYLQAPGANLHDVVGGKNGNCNKRVGYLCQAVTGYDGPTGLGTPNGVGGF